MRHPGHFPWPTEGSPAAQVEWFRELGQAAHPASLRPRSEFGRHQTITDLSQDSQRAEKPGPQKLHVAYVHTEAPGPQ